MTMSISTVIGSLEHDASLAMAEAASTPDYREVVVSMERARRWRAMADAVRLATRAAPVTASKARTVKTPKVATLGAVAFWNAHGVAVAAITGKYGAMWKVRAPFGETVLTSLATGLRTHTTERGTKIKWGRDHRMPAAKYWTGGIMPAGVTVEADYARHDPSNVVTHDAAWHLARGYILVGKDWISEMQDRASRAHAEAIEDNRLLKLATAAAAYGPQPAMELRAAA